MKAKNILASRKGIKEKQPTKDKKLTGKASWTSMSDHPTRGMLGVRRFNGTK